MLPSIFLLLSGITLGNALASESIDCVTANSDQESLFWLGTIRYFSPLTGRLYPCSGVAITSRHVLAPAHCVIWQHEKDYSFRTGGETHHIRRIFIHPKYTLERSDNDIAVLQLGDDSVVSSCLPLAEEVQAVALTAWRFDVATTTLGPKGKNRLRTSKITSQAYCQRNFESLVITEHEVCAHIPTDSPILMGSALLDRGMENGTETWQLLGISTHGLPASKRHMPTLFTLVSAHRKWINEIINL